MTLRLDFVTFIMLGATVLLLVNQGLHQDSGTYAQPAFHVREALQPARELQPRLNCLVNRTHRLVQVPDDYVLAQSGANAVTGERLVCLSVQQTAEVSSVESVAFERVAELDKPQTL
ncbi:MAG: hypothetical protein ACREUQ_09400 [Burkholderiales bacterium]